jgi:hypothetical protein
MVLIVASISWRWRASLTTFGLLTGGGSSAILGDFI